MKNKKQHKIVCGKNDFFQKIHKFSQITSPAEGGQNRGAPVLARHAAAPKIHL